MAAGIATASFTYTRSMTVDGVADGNGMIEVPMRSKCWRADRVRR